jgi:hypothetical protein
MREMENVYDLSTHHTFLNYFITHSHMYFIWIECKRDKLYSTKMSFSFKRELASTGYLCFVGNIPLG